MASLDDASLAPLERRVLERFVRLLEDEFESDLRGVWLYGSRARGERPQPESDVDVLVIAQAGAGGQRRVIELADEAAEAEGQNPGVFSVRLYTPERLSQRREIRSFFIQEVDRDKIVLAGTP